MTGYIVKGVISDLRFCSAHFDVELFQNNSL